MAAREIPARTYVQFTFEGPYGKAGAVHAYLYSTWLGESAYELAAPYNIEVYDERYRGPESEETVTEIWSLPG